VQPQGAGRLNAGRAGNRLSRRLQHIGIVMSVLGAIVGEFIGAKAGLGYLLLQMNYNLDVAGMFAVLVVLGVPGIVLNFTTRVIRDRVIFWQRDTSVTL
jgi:NitT/TauT family transport system permease protein